MTRLVQHRLNSNIGNCALHLTQSRYTGANFLSFNLSWPSFIIFALICCRHNLCAIPSNSSLAAASVEACPFENANMMCLRISSLVFYTPCFSCKPVCISLVTYLNIAWYCFFVSFPVPSRNAIGMGAFRRHLCIWSS